MQPHHALRGDALLEPGGHAGDVGRFRRGVLGHVTRRFPGLNDVERQLARLLAQLLQRVLAGRGVEQIGRHRGVHLQASEVDAQREQRAHGFLDVVPDHRVGQESVELLGHRGRGQQRTGDQDTKPGFVSFGGDEDEPGQFAAPRDPGPAGRQRSRPVPSVPSCLVTSPAVTGTATSRRSKVGGTGSGGAAPDPVGAGAPRPAPGGALPSAGSPNRPSSSTLRALPDRPHFEPGEDVLRVLQVPPAEGQLADVDQEWHVGDQRDDFRGRSGQVLVRRQVLAQLGRELVEMPEDPVQILVAGQ